MSLTLFTNYLQILQAHIAWKQCTELPINICNGKTTVVGGKVYCGGGLTDENEFIVYCYDPSQDKWTTLPPLPVKWFGLGQVNGNLVAVGGKKEGDLTTANDVYTYDEPSETWEQIIPPMPTARDSPGVLSLPSALVVAGGDGGIWAYTATVEIFKPDTSQWYITEPLPTACEDVSLTYIGNTCYALGGWRNDTESHLNQALYAIVDDLLCSAELPANETTYRRSSGIWKTLPNTPTYRPAAAVLAGSLVALGGCETSTGGAGKKEVYMYSPSTNSWIYVSDLPIPRSRNAVAVLSPTEVLVIGGLIGFIKVNTIIKGTLIMSIL